ncbi:MAG: peptidylprolyl isomerase [Acidobacteriota bacterium]
MKHSEDHGLVRLLVLVLLLCPAIMAQEAPAPVRVVIETEMGAIEVEIAPAQAPVTCGNFLKYVEGGFYDSGQFHRTVKPDNQPNNKVLIEVVQAGVNPEQETRGFPPIPLERTNKTGLRHQDGTISMARGAPDTATSDFFICIGDQPSLDFGGARNPDGQGFAAFGRVVRGMDVVRRIQASPAEGQRLTPPIRILKIGSTATEKPESAERR